MQRIPPARPARPNEPTAPTDAELVEGARRGDAAAWRAIIRRYTPTLYRVAARMLGPGAEAEDACQEAFLRAHRGFGGYDAARPLGPWLARIAYHAALKRLAAPRRAGEAIDPSALERIEDAVGPSPEHALAALETGALLTAALGQLSAQDRALVTLRYVDGLTDLEVGEAVGMNRNTVRTRLHRARLVLQKVLGPVLGGRSS